jgi:restriction system protein
MARRSTRTSPPFDELLMKLPPWVCFMLGVGSYAVLEWLQHTHIASKSEPFFSLTTSLYAPMALAFFVTFAAFSAVHRVRRAKLVDQQTGLDSLRHTPWKDFEVLVAEAFRRQGYTADYSLDTGPDGGVDILLKKAGRTALVQCKRWKEWSVGVSVVREMFGILHDRKADEVFIVTTGHFTPDAVAFAKGKPVKLIDGSLLWEMVRQVQGESKAGPVSSPNVQADSLLTDSPECPKCGGEMLYREAKQGATAGSFFWSCSRFPQCRGNRSILAEEKPTVAV